MSFLLNILDFVVSFFAIMSSILLIMMVVKGVVNPDFYTDEEGKPVDRETNIRLWLAVIAAACWSFIIAF